jgi:D-alanyl-D-alanine carboxypeptidase (penicillin-binding protein 5/6)
VVYARQADRRLAIASTTKLMTALVTLRRAPLDRVVRVAAYPAGGDESTAGLQDGARVTVRDLLRAMLLPSANEAAFTLAIRIGGSLGAFVAAMNADARALHLTETHYATPVGLDTPGNYSSARDLAHLAAVLLRDPFFAATVRRPAAALPSAGNRVVVNRNDLVGHYPFVVGIKTGHTLAAGQCLVGAASRDGVHLISVVLGDSSEDTRDADTLSLLRYGLALYHEVTPVRAGQVYARVPVAGRRSERLALVARRSASLVLRRGTGLTVYTRGVPAQARGPLRAGTPLGEVVVRRGSQVLARVPLVSATALAALPPKGVSLAGLLGGIGGGVAVLGLLPVAWQRRRASRAHR